MGYLELENIQYSIDGIDILRGINLEIEKGDCISIIGSSGSGKSTLLKLCADLIEQTEGKIKFKDREYEFYNPIELRKRISYCIQIPCLFNEKVKENLEFPFKIRKKKVNEKRIIELLKKFNLEEEILKKKVYSLSGGEKQRVALIRNLIYKPEILLLDEVTSALDEKNAKVVEAYISELNKEGVTVLWSTHDKEQSNRIFNKKIKINKGLTEKIEKMEKCYE